MLQSMRLRLTLSFILLLAIFGYFVFASVTHSQSLQHHFDGASQQHHIRIALSTFIFALLPFVAVGAWIIVTRTLKPLIELSHQASQASADNLAVRLTSPSSDSEMVGMVDTINDLLGRIEASVMARSQFYAAASHELRTPLQALSGQLETALSKDRTADEYRSTMVEALRQTERINRLMHDILLLHQLQSGPSYKNESANISQAIQITLNELTPLIEVRAVKIICDKGSEVVVKGNQSYAEVIIRNLIENAVRYSLEGSEIGIRLLKDKFVISNTAERKFDPSMQGFFEPFFRVDGARARSQGGNGLGLAVCLAAAKANDWIIEVNTSANIVIVTVTFSKNA